MVKEMSSLKFPTLRTHRFALLPWVLFLGGASTLLGSSAQGSSFHWEFGLGASQFSGSPSWPEAPPTGLKRSYSLMGSFLVDLTNERSKIKTPLGLVYRNQSGQDTANNLHYTFQTLWLIFRVELPRFYVGLQGTNLVYLRSDEYIGFSNASPAPQTAGVALEIGAKWPISPEVLFFVAATGSSFLSNNEWNPKIYDFSLGLRFRIDAPNKKEAGRKFFGEGESLDDYQGWRYPYGKGI